MNKIARRSAFVATGLALVSAGANAAMDVSSATAVIGEGVVAVGAIGVAVLGVVGAAAAWKYIRRAF